MGPFFSKARYMNGVGFEILARTPVPHLPSKYPFPPPPSARGPTHHRTIKEGSKINYQAFLGYLPCVRLPQNSHIVTYLFVASDTRLNFFLVAIKTYTNNIYSVAIKTYTNNIYSNSLSQNVWFVTIYHLRYILHQQ